MNRYGLLAVTLLLAGSACLRAEDADLQVVVTGVQGLVQARLSEDQPWKKAAVGMKLDAGAAFRTGPRSAVRFTIPPDQTITLDRLGTMQVLQAVKSAQGKIKTELGMKYGRTRYEIEATGLEHASTIYTPSAQLAVRGTEVGVQEDFTGAAWCTESQAFFTGKNQQQITFGAGSEVSDKDPDPGQKRLVNDKVDAKDPQSREPLENEIIVDQVDGALNLRQNHLLQHKKLFSQTETHQPMTSNGDLQFSLAWNNSESNGTNFANAFYDMDLFVIAPNAPDTIIFAENPHVPASGATIQTFVNQSFNPNAVVTNNPPQNAVDFVIDDGDLGPVGPTGSGDGQRTERIIIENQFFLGNYVVGVHIANFQSGADPTPGDVTYQLKATKFIPGIGPVAMQTELVDFVIQSLPTATHTINVPAGAATPEPIGFIPVPRDPPTQ